MNLYVFLGLNIVGLVILFVILMLGLDDFKEALYATIGVFTPILLIEIGIKLIFIGFST